MTSAARVTIDCPRIRWEITRPGSDNRWTGRDKIDLKLPPGRYDVIYRTSRGNRHTDWFEVRPNDPRFYIRGDQPWPPDAPEPGPEQLPLF